ncbi:MAG: TIGR00269 family protein [Nanoarchaeota archaeon]|nr:TIGR00269 family protein [Nanoarchaeota archaeon]MBU1135585.1 TIGR00269 family protein [Nanoarchaeota archaeon]MBU2520359.1 TIGR00269 family protein [Nanoarchaeota archaeon]
MKKEDQEFVENFEREVKEIIKEYKLLDKKDKVIVACSGGKDSTSILYIIKKFGYNPDALIIDLSKIDYFQDHLKNIKDFCTEQKIKLHIIGLEEELIYPMCHMTSVMRKKEGYKSCTVCGVMKRYLLNKKPRELGATKIVTGHNLDDEAQTVIMNMFRADMVSTINAGPKVDRIKDDKFVIRVKPFYFTKEADIKKYSELMKFPVQYIKCPCSGDSLRNFMRQYINKLEEKYPGIKRNIVDSSLLISDQIRKSLPKDMKIRSCERCGEPTNNETCAACIMLKTMSSK